MKSKRSKRPEVRVNGDVVGSLYLRGRLWWFDHRGHGVRAPQSLQTTDLKEALTLAEKLAQGIAPIPQAPTLVERLQQKTVREALKLYTEKHLQRKCRASAAQRAADALEPFASFVGEDLPLVSVTRKLVERFLDSRTKTCKNVTINGDKRRVGGFLNWCEREELIARAPNMKGLTLPEEEKVARGLTAAEIETIRTKLSSFKHERMRDLMMDWFEVAINVGLRPQEQSHLRAEDYDPVTRKVSIRPWGDWVLKTRKAKRSPKVNTAAHEILSRLKRQAERVAAERKMARLKAQADAVAEGRKLADEAELPALLFPTSTGSVWDVNNLRHWFRGAKYSVLPPETFFTLYCLRNSYAYRAVTAGMNPVHLMKRMGHTRLSTTQMYFEGVDMDSFGDAPELEPVQQKKAQ